MFPIYVPPLRERRGDIESLVGHFLARISAAETRGRVKAISGRALAMLEAYDWPGNIRQLENAVFRATVLCEGATLTEEEFPQIRAQVEGFVDLDHESAPVPAGRRDDEMRGDFDVSEELQPVAGVLKVLDDRGNVRALADVELDMIRMAIDHYNGQMSEVARRLGIGRSTLYRKLKEYGIDPDTGRSQDGEGRSGERLAS